MRANLSENISRCDVADAVGLSEWHFSRVFHEAVGESYSKTLQRCRVDRASELLIRSDRPLAEIALECGFADQSHFTKVFRRNTGRTPGQVRQERKSRESHE
jgi:transcriptional regulator GlxA family with amidase domain